MANQKIYISTDLAHKAVADKTELDCLAFCVMCKLMFGSSVIRKTTAREYKRMFRMGTQRFNRIMSDCIAKGYITEQVNSFKVGRIKQAKAQNMVIELAMVWGRGDKRSAITLNEAKDYIRKVVAYDKFDKKDAIENALKAKANPKNLKSYKKALRLCSRISHNSALDGKLRGTSMSRIAATMGTYKAKARKLSRQMVADGWLSNSPITIKTGFRLEQFSQYALAYVKQLGWHGSYFRVGHDIFCRVANIYKLEGDSKLRYLRSI